MMTGDDLAAALRRHRLRQHQFAVLMGVAKSTVSRWVTGDLDVPRYVDAYFTVADELRRLLRTTS